MSEPSLRISYQGRGGEFFVLLIKNFFLVLITLGVYNFWARVNAQRYMFEHATLAGGRFGWHATGKERFIAFLKAVLIFAAILGINALLAKISRYLSLVLPIAIIVLLPAIIVAMYRFRLSRASFNQVRFRFTGRAGNLAALTLRGAMLTVITFGFYAPWLVIQVRQYLYRHTAIGNSSFDYDGVGGDLFWIYFKGIMLTTVTFGIWQSWFTAEVANYHTNHTIFQGQRLRGDVDGADVFVTNFVGKLLIFVTLGIYAPWWMINLQRVMLQGISLTSMPDFSQMKGMPDADANALAEGLADAANLLDNIADFLT